MGRPAASLANLKPWNSTTARIAGAFANKVRWTVYRKTRPKFSPDPSPESTAKDPIIRKVERLLHQTDSAPTIAKLVDARGKLMAQARNDTGSSKPTTAPAKPLSFLP